MTSNWKSFATVSDGQKCEIDGLNIWDYGWKNTGEQVTVKDPLYQHDYTMVVYEITNDNKTIKFAAGEFSNTIWGIYIESID